MKADESGIGFRVSNIPHSAFRAPHSRIRLLALDIDGTLVNSPINDVAGCIVPVG